VLVCLVGWWKTVGLVNRWAGSLRDGRGYSTKQSSAKTQCVVTWCTRTQDSKDTKLKRQDSKDKLKMQEDKEAEVSVESHSHHQDGHARGGPCSGDTVVAGKLMMMTMYM
jgi:hypothetical protein